MSSRNPLSTNGFRKKIRRPSHENDEPSQMGNQDIGETAQLIADGVVPFPDGLPSSEFDRLIRHVRWLRRKRLVRFIARQIALDIQSHQE